MQYSFKLVNHNALTGVMAQLSQRNVGYHIRRAGADIFFVIRVPAPTPELAVDFAFNLGRVIAGEEMAAI